MILVNACHMSNFTWIVLPNMGVNSPESLQQLSEKNLVGFVYLYTIEKLNNLLTCMYDLNLAASVVQFL